MSGYDPSQPGPPLGGVDVNGVYRDPWGNPYIISMDLNYDENCKDAFYSLQSVSQENGQTGWNGLINPDAPATPTISNCPARSWSGPQARMVQLVGRRSHQGWSAAPFLASTKTTS